MNYEQEEKNTDSSQEKQEFDPAAETKQKLVFFAVAIVILLILKFAMGL